MGKRILLVDDEPLILKGLKYTLEQDGYETDTAVDGQEALDKFFSGVYDLVLLDVMLPKVDGLSVCQRIRETSSVPIIMLTAKGEDMDKILGLEYGADDYMTKPFSPTELMAHLRALTRRQGEVEFETLRAFNLTLDLTEREFVSESSSIPLSAKEFALARVLMSNAGKTVPKATIVDRVWGTTGVTEDNNVEAYVSFLRKKLRFLEANAHIETIRGVGYRLAEGRDA